MPPSSSPSSNMSLSDAASEGGPSTIYGLSEAGNLDNLASRLRWEHTPRREGEFMAGQSTGERTKQYFRHVNGILTRLQRSGLRVEIMEPPVVAQDAVDFNMETELAFCGAWASEDLRIDEFTTTECILD